MIVTIDGPAGAGKSSVARKLAERLRFRFLDTGAMYRAVTLAAVGQGIDWKDAEALTALARRLSIQLKDQRVYVDGHDVTDRLRTAEITSLSRYAADNAGVRRRLVQLQRDAARGRDVVTEGRDQGTVVFPDAECKIFLTATPQERARRRYLDLKQGGEEITLDDVLAAQRQRDLRDTTRAVGALKKAPDAVEVTTDDQTPDQVVKRLEALVRQRMS